MSNQQQMPKELVVLISICCGVAVAALIFVFAYYCYSTGRCPCCIDEAARQRRLRGSSSSSTNGRARRGPDDSEHYDRQLLPADAVEAAVSPSSGAIGSRSPNPAARAPGPARPVQPVHMTAPLGQHGGARGAHAAGGGGGAAAAPRGPGVHSFQFELQQGEAPPEVAGGPDRSTFLLLPAGAAAGEDEPLRAGLTFQESATAPTGPAGRTLMAAAQAAAAAHATGDTTSTTSSVASNPKAHRLLRWIHESSEAVAQAKRPGGAPLEPAVSAEPVLQYEDELCLQQQQHAATVAIRVNDGAPAASEVAGSSVGSGTAQVSSEDHSPAASAPRFAAMSAAFVNPHHPSAFMRSPHATPPAPATGYSTPVGRTATPQVQFSAGQILGGNSDSDDSTGAATPSC